MANTNNWPFEKPSSSYNWDTAKQNTDPWAFEKVPSSYNWDTAKQNTDPWAFEKQEIKLGYINNPYWQESAEFSDVHNPCGYWHKGDPGYTPYVPPPPLSKSYIYSTGDEVYQALIRDPEIDHQFFRQIDDTGSFLVSAIGNGAQSLHIKEDHTLWGIGHNGNGALGTGASDNLTILTQIGSDNDWADVRMSREGTGLHSIALKLDGTIWTTGENSYGQLGHGDTEKRYGFTKVGSDSDWAYIEAGYDCCFAIKENGLMYSWGYGGSGQLGHNNYTNYNAPKMIEGLAQWEQITSYGRSSIGLRNGGLVYSTGLNGYGQLCLNSTTPYIVREFTQRTVGDAWKSVKSGYRFAILIKNNDSLWGAGLNVHGQLGLGDTDTHTNVTEIDSGNWSKIATGHSHTLCIDENGILYTAGYNVHGELGLGDANDRHVLTKVEGTDWNLVAGGGYFSFAGKIA